MISPAHRIFLRTFGNPNRIMLLLELLRGPKNVTVLIQRSGMEQSAVSHNLKRLLRCRFVTVRRKGKERIYAVNRSTIGPLVRLMNRHIAKHCRHLCSC